VFTSSMMVRNFLDLASQMKVRDTVIQVLNSKGMVVAAIGHPTANTLNMYEIQVTTVSSEYTFKALIHEVKKEFGIDHD
jgi:uroporphyrinogen-III synthase